MTDEPRPDEGSTDGPATGRTNEAASLGATSTGPTSSPVSRWLLPAGGLLLLAGAVGLGFGLTSGPPADPAVGDTSPSAAAAPTEAAQSAPPSPAGESQTPLRTISMSATGDIIMGSAPSMMPVNNGVGFFDSVREALASDLVMGNLEQALTEDTGTSKCGADNSGGCYQFRLPPSYAAVLADAGFNLVTIANNHTADFGETGYANTKTSLTEVGIEFTGDRDAITVTEVEGVKVAVIGFSPYPAHNMVSDIPSGEALVRKADATADIVVVQAQMGAEGSDQVNTPYGSEIFFGEDRGNVREFSRAMVDAGADIIIGHSPHVLRGMEFYNGHLIAYSLGNFAGGGNTLSNQGPLGLGGILRFSLNSDGTWDSGQFVSTYLDGAGLPTLDPTARSLDLVRSLNATDFPDTGVQFEDDGMIIAPAGASPAQPAPTASQ